MAKTSELSHPRSGARVAFRRAPAAASWDERCSALFEDLRKPARVMIGRAFGRALSADEIDDVYANAWTSTLSALRGRAERMSDEELRSYLLTAVANHASKEMRRRRRKPTSELSDSHAQVLADAHQPSPEERAVGSESGSLARDVLASLPPRRRAVMLLRYGWGLDPTEICSLVDGLSPRAYRKEITRGVGEMIDRIGQAERGEWCRTREPLLRDLVAGTADADGRRQAQEHLGHCRHCSELVGRLGGQLHDLGSGLAGWTAAAGAVGGDRGGFGGRLGAALDRGREALGGAAGRADDVSEGAAALVATGGARGAGAAGAGAIAKLAGLGAAGKAALACIGAGVAATACVAGGVLPAPALRSNEGERSPAPKLERSARALTPAPTVDAIQVAEPRPQGSAGGGANTDQEPVEQQAEPRTAPEGAPASSPAPSAPAEQQEFGLPAAAPTSEPAPSSGSGDGSGTASGGEVAQEFGP